MLNRLIKSLLLFLALILITSISCTNSKTLDDNSREILPIEKSSLTINAELNDLKTELATQQSEIKSKAFQVSALEETKKSLSNQLSEKNQKLSNLEIQLKETNSKLIKNQKQLDRVEYPIAIMSSDNEIVTFEAPPKRIVAFDSSAVEILFDIGESKRIVATHAFATHPEAIANIPKVGDAFNIDLEAIVALEPDLVYVFYKSNVEPLRNLGLKVLYIKTLDHDFEKTTDLIKMWGRITNNMEGANKSITTFNQNIELITQKIDSATVGPRIFQDIGGLWTPGSNTLVNEVFSLLKTNNIAKEINGYAQISPEIIVEKNPQIIITVNPKFFLDNQAYKNVSAVKTGNVYTIESNSLSVPGPRFPNGIREIATIVYPDKFDNVENK